MSNSAMVRNPDCNYSWPLNNTGLKWHRSTYMQIFFSNIVVLLYPWLSHLWIQPTAHWKHYFPSANVEDWLCIVLCHFKWEGLEHPWIWISKRVLEPIPRGHWGTLKSSVSQKLYGDFSTMQGSSPPNHSLFRGQLYIYTCVFI